MYQTDFICTYKLHDKDDQADMYRIQLLQAFDLTEWNDEKVDVVIRSLFEKVGTNPDIQSLIESARQSKCCEAAVMLVDGDDLTIFTNLFQYQLFDVFHRCVSDVINNERMNEENRKMMECFLNR